MNINEKLKKLYESKWDALTAGVRKIPGINIEHPLLLQVGKDYEKADVKVIIYGQETDNWHGKFPSLSVKKLMTEYYNYLYEVANKKRNTKRPFWNNHNFKYFENEFNDHYKQKNKTVSFLWNNISKIEGKPRKKIRKLERDNFKVIKDEVKILQPDVILFTTGKSRDGHIKHAFGENNVDFKHSKISFAGSKGSFTDERSLAKINLLEFPNILAFRFDHPNRRTMDKELIRNVIFQFLDAMKK
jgi:hypothetical protein